MKTRPLNMPYRAIIADDHEIVRQGLRTALETPGMVESMGLKVVAETANGIDTIAEVKIHKPDLLLLDIAMPFADGTEVLPEIKRWSPATRIVVVTGSNGGGLVCNLLETGVDGMFYKGASLDELYRKLPLILRGGRYIADPFLQAMEKQDAAQSLTARERQILNMIVTGKTNKEMAELLFISPKTVDKHRTSLMTKLHVHSLVELLAYALREGLIDPANISGQS
ncbi:LuxR C-terminal-related transcriptional regulator [Methylomarinum vadi]|uniref:LuxR C-terminal-related transcriptional regulator n=1 Tax=Methylomarinum vadi TaxID=438855 RepID=UPI0004DF6276|nr:response regulator transcription factor [Methylomarinum vadi]